MKKQTSEIEEKILLKIPKRIYLHWIETGICPTFILQDEKKKWINDLRKWTKGKEVTKDKLREYLNKLDEI